MSKLSRIGGLTRSITLIAAMVGAGVASAAKVDFEAAEGYSVGSLFGQPGPAPQWTGDDTTKIRVSDAQAQSGGQSVLLDPDADTGRVANGLAVGFVPNEFSLRFFWRPTGTVSGNAAVYLSEFEGVTNAGVGPWVQFDASGDFYQIKYLEGGFVRNIKLGMLPETYENVWSEVEIIGDISTRTFDFYLNGAPEATGLPFRTTVVSGLANQLNYLNLQAATAGASDHAFDAFQIRISTVPGVPTLSQWGVLLLMGVLVTSAVWIAKQRFKEQDA